MLSGTEVNTMNRRNRIGVLFALVTSALFLLSAGTASAGGGDRPATTCGGWVHDASTGLAVSGATVTGFGLTTTTASDGTYRLAPIYTLTGSSPVTASRVGYISQTQTVTLVYHQAGTAYFSLTPQVTLYTISGTIRGSSYDYLRTYVLAGATITAKQETSPGAYTGVVLTTTASSSGYYSLSVPGGRMYDFSVVYHDHATYDAHLTISSTQTKDVSLRCQWNEVPQPWELTGGSRNADNARIFERDVNGDGIVDSLNLFLDVNGYFEQPYSVLILPGFFNIPYPPLIRPDSTMAEYWIELQGCQFSHNYNTMWDDPDYGQGGVVPTVHLNSNGYYSTDHRIVVRVKTNMIYKQVLTIPETPNHGSYHVIANKLILDFRAVTQLHPTSQFCSVYPASLSLDSTLAPLQHLVVFDSSSNWPVSGDGNGIYESMASHRYPDTQSFQKTAEADLNSWPLNDYVITFGGDFKLDVYGTVYETGESGIWNWVTGYDSDIFGFAIDSTPYLPDRTSQYVFADDFADFEAADWDVLQTGGSALMDVGQYGQWYPSMILERIGGQNGNVQAGHTFAAQTGHFYFEARLRMTTANPTYGGMYVSLLDSSGNTVCHICIARGTVQWLDLGGWHPTGASFALNTWYLLGLDVDTATQKYNLYLGGTLVFQGMSFYYQQGHASVLRFQSGDAGTSGVTVNQWIDDVSVRSTPLSQIFTDTFPYSSLSGWSTKVNKNGYVGTSTTYVSSPYGLEVMKSTTVTGYSSATATFAPQTGNYVLAQAYMKVDSLCDGTHGYAYFYVGGGMVTFAFANGYLRHYDDTHGWQSLMSFSPGTWYLIRFNIDSNSGKYSVSIQPTGGTTTTWSGCLLRSGTSISSVGFTAGWNDLYGGVNMYVDDVYVRASSSPIA